MIEKLLVFFMHVIVEKIGHIQKKYAKKQVYFNEIILLIIMEMKNRSHSYDINKSRPRYRHIY